MAQELIRLLRMSCCKDSMAALGMTLEGELMVACRKCRVCMPLAEALASAGIVLEVEVAAMPSSKIPPTSSNASGPA